MIPSASPLVSVIIPTFNHAHFLRAALDSVCKQTAPSWEAIVVNNFSTDETIALVQSYSEPRIRLINFENHGVIGAARNQGIAASKGRYIAFLDSDDVWFPEKLARSVTILEQGFDLVCHGEYWLGRGNPRKVCYGPASHARFDALLFQGNCLSTSAVVVRKSVLDRCGGFSEKPEFITAEDYHLWMKLARDGTRMSFSPEPLGEYRIHSGNQSKAVLRNMQAELAVVEEFLSSLKSASVLTRIRARRRRALAYYGAGRGLHATAKPAEALLWFAKAFLTFPLIPRLYVAAALSSFWCIKRAGRKTATAV